MGWESGCFPASVMITWTGLWPSVEFKEQVLEQTSGERCYHERRKKTATQYVSVICREHG